MPNLVPIPCRAYEIRRYICPLRGCKAPCVRGTITFRGDLGNSGIQSGELDEEARAARLANALRSLGVDGDQRVGTFMWNNAEHLEAYLAIPSMGAVLHTLNLRLAPDQVGYIATHAGDYAVIVDPAVRQRAAACGHHQARDRFRPCR